MREKYLIQISNNGEVITEAKFKTKKEIEDKYSLEIPVINQIIKLNNTPNYTLKKQHNQYKELYNNFKIYLIKII